MGDDKEEAKLRKKEEAARREAEAAKQGTAAAPTTSGSGGGKGGGLFGLFGSSSKVAPAPGAGWLVAVGVAACLPCPTPPFTFHSLLGLPLSDCSRCQGGRRRRTEHRGQHPHQQGSGGDGPQRCSGRPGGHSGRCP